MPMSSIFTVIHPVIPLTFNRLLDFINQSYVLEMPTASRYGNDSHTLLIKGILSVSIHDLTTRCISLNLAAMPEKPPANQQPTFQ